MEPFRIRKREPLLAENLIDLILFPIKYPKLWEAYKKAEASFWTAEEIDFSIDMDHWVKLSDDEQHFIKNVLAFFAGSDGIVLQNITQRFANEIQIPEARCFYGFQMAIENIHISETYSLLIDKYIKEPEESVTVFSTQLILFQL